ncbi:MAG: glycosyltransferase family 2 protein, partial [Algoriella sp.]
MKTAIAILNWNGEKSLPQFLPSVINNSKDAEIYIIDNAST